MRGNGVRGHVIKELLIGIWLMEAGFIKPFVTSVAGETVDGG